mgnify:CR=1 FL=1
MTAWFAMVLWPVISAVLFMRATLPVAVSVTIIGGYLLLPTQTEINLPVLPTIDKYSVPTLVAILGVLLSTSKDRLAPGWLPRDPVVLLLLGVLVVGAFGTALTNSDFLSLGARTGLRLYDGFSIVLSSLIMLLPFLLGRKVLATVQAQRTFLVILITAALAYSLLALWEVRMSPQLNRILYGFFPHSWIQHLRAGGFRPVVFLEHGLWLGIFFTTAATAAFAMVRASTGKARVFFLCTGLWLLGVVFLSKVLGALLILLTMIPICLMLSRRLQLLAAIAIAGMVLLYPTLRSIDVLPMDRVVRLAAQVDADRMQSFLFRLEQEDALLERARERPVFGWGGFGRNRVLDTEGRDISTTDGKWVIEFGQGGWVRYIAVFGLLTWGIMGLLPRRRVDLDPVTLALALALSANLVDILPNAGVSPVTWMIAGAMIGNLERLRAGHQNAPSVITATDDEGQRQGAPVYSRGELVTRDVQAPEVGEKTPDETRAGPRYRRDFKTAAQSHRRPS